MVSENCFSIVVNKGAALELFSFISIFYLKQNTSLYQYLFEKHK